MDAQTECEAAGILAVAMDQAARAVADRLKVELTPGRLCLAALFVAAQQARAAGMSLRQWGIFVRLVRSAVRDAAVSK